MVLQSSGLCLALLAALGCNVALAVSIDAEFAGKPKPLPMAPLPRLPPSLRGAHGMAIEVWLTPLKPPPAALPARPVAVKSQGAATPQAAGPPPPASLAYDVGSVYAGKDVQDGWQLVRLTKGPDSEGVFAADVLANVSSLGGSPAVLDHWPRVYGTEEFLRPLPPPPPVSLEPGALPPGVAVFVRGLKPGEWAASDGFGQKGDDQKTPEFVLYPGTWPLQWSQGEAFHTASGGPGVLAPPDGLAPR